MQGLLRLRLCGAGYVFTRLRAVAVTLTYVCGVRLTPDDFRAILRSGDREQAGPTLPAHGLFMNRLWYDHTPELAPFRLDS